MENYTCTSLSSNSVTTSYWKLDGEDATYGYIFASFLLLFIMFGLPLNILVFVAVIWKKLYRDLFVHLLLNVIVTDVALSVIPVPVLMMSGFAGEYFFGGTDMIRCQTCQISYITIILTSNSHFCIAVMSLDRLLYICKPLKYDRLVSKWKIYVSILIAWGLSIITGLTFRVYSLTNVIFRPIFLSCPVRNNKFLAIILIIMFSAGLVVIIVCNAFIVQIVLKNIKMIYFKLNSGQENEIELEINEKMKKTRQEKQLHLFRTFGALLILNLLVWLPYLLLIMSLVTVEFFGMPKSAIIFLLLLFYSQSVIHPIGHTVFMADVRKILLNCVTCGIRGRRRDFTTQENSKKSTISSEKKCRNSCLILKVINGAVIPPVSNATPNGTSTQFIKA